MSTTRVDIDVEKTGLHPTVVEEIITCILRYSDPERILLYGSRAGNDFDRTSDIDIAVEGVGSDRALKIHLEEEVRTLLYFDVVYLDEAPQKLRRRILETGLTLYERESSN